MVQYFPVVTGSLTVTGSVNISGAITASGGISISGSIASASYADTASFVTLAQTASFVTTAQTASFVTTAQTASYVLNAVSSSLAATASSADNLLVRNTLTAQTLVVQTITSSVDFVTGSTIFGSLSSNTHVFTGSLAITGALNVNAGTTTVGILSGSSALFSSIVGVNGSSEAGWALKVNGNSKVESASGTTVLQINETATGGKTWSLITSGNGNVHSSPTGSFYLRNSSDSITALLITSTGNVGIGTTNPDIFGRGDARMVGIDVSGASDNLALALDAGASGGRGAQIYMGQGGTRHFTISSNATESTIGTVSSTPLRFTTGDTEKMRITGSNVGIGTVSPSDFIDAGLGLAIINTSGRTGLSLGSTQSTANEVLGRLSFTNTNSTNIGSKRLAYVSGVRGTTDNSAYLEFGTADNALGTQRVVISQEGNVFINNSSGVSLNGLTNKLSVSSTTYNLFDISRFSDNAYGSIGGNTIVASGDNLGNITWVGANGTGFTDAAAIKAEVDGTPGASNDMPGRLVFSTTADGAGSVTERMRINSSGNILMSATTAPSVPSGNIMVFNNTIFFDYTSGVGSPYTSNLRVDIVWNNWGSNHVAALIDVDFLAREFGNLGGVSFGRIYALSSGGATTFNNTINTANVTTANGTLAVSSPANFMLRLLFTPTNIKDYIGCFIRIPVNSAGTGAAVASITATLV